MQNTRQLRLSGQRSDRLCTRSLGWREAKSVMTMGTGFVFLLLLFPHYTRENVNFLPLTGSTEACFYDFSVTQTADVYRTRKDDKNTEIQNITVTEGKVQWLCMKFRRNIFFQSCVDWFVTPTSRASRYATLFEDERVW